MFAPGITVASVVILWFLGSASATKVALQHDDLGSDLSSFVTRPDIRAPRWNVTKYKPKLITPGYWFVAPYTEWNTMPDRSEYTPSQVGPHIYDSDGVLIWSGSPLSRNRNAFDFRTFEANGSTHLSYVLHRSERKMDDESHGYGVMMDPSYRRISMFSHDIGQQFNFHEFDIRENGTKALFLTTDQPTRVEPQSNETGVFAHDCIHDAYLHKEDGNFVWCPLDNGVNFNESYHEMPDLSGLNYLSPWDFFHGNSIDKFQDGDYLLSSRHTNTLYRINHTSSNISWRLGGKISDFTMDFNFSSQHHAVVASENETTVVLTLFDNASDDQQRQPDSANTSSVKMIALEMETMKARLVRQWYRPDGKLSSKRGNANIMPNGNMFIGWSERGYMSEHTMSGQMVFEASFLSSRFSTYRAYKANFTGLPLQPPIIKSFIIRSPTDKSYGMTTSHVSWNGATEVKTWQFYGSRNASTGYRYLGKVQKTGFETTFSEKGMWRYVYAEALAGNGTALGKTKIGAASFLPGSLPALRDQNFFSHFAAQTTTQFSQLSSAAAAVGSVFVLLAMEVVLVVLYLTIRRGRRSTFARWPAHDEDQVVRLLSWKEMNE